MKDLIDRYVYDVVRRLPEKERAEVRKELLSNISDMLPEEPDEQAVIKVLTELGPPEKLAEQYRQKPRFLISPAVFDEYVFVLKLVFIIVSLVVMSVGLIEDFSKLLEMPTLIDVLTSVITNLLRGAVIGAQNSFLWVTLAFFLVEQSQAKQPPKEWSVKDLPMLPPEGSIKISRGETVTGLVFTVVFNILFIVMSSYFPQAIGWYDEGKPVVPLFNGQVLRTFIPFFVLLALCSLAVSAFKLYYGRWNLLLIVINTVYNILGTIFALIFINFPNLFNEAFIHRCADEIHLDYAAMVSEWEKGKFIFSAIILVIALFELGKSIWLTCRILRKENYYFIRGRS